MINTNRYYSTYHGHLPGYLKKIRDHMIETNSNEKIVYLAGDSSLDNKYWISETHTNAIGKYANILLPPYMKKDICYYLSKHSNLNVINTAIEATTLAERDNKLLVQDKFIRDNIRENDTLIISVGGNDIALSPSLSTIFNMAKLVCMNTTDTISKGPKYAWGMPYFLNMFNDKITKYIEKLTSKTKPAKIIICTIYYPDEKMTNSWADKSLGYIGYNKDPKKLQEVIKQIHKRGTCKIKIPSTTVIPFPMYHVLDGKITTDYIHRVEPSESGGEKLAIELSKII